MKLKRFRIYGYKSIIDTGYCDLSSDITILAGKNESGKTSILEALQDFGKGVISKDSKNIEHQDIEPKIECVFSVSKEVLENTDAPIPTSIKKHIEVNNLTLSLEEDSYSFDEPFINALEKEQPAKTEEGNTETQEDDGLYDKLLDYFIKKIPTFIMYSDLENKLKYETPITEAIQAQKSTNISPLKDFLTLLSVDIEKIKDADTQTKSNTFLKKSVSLSGDFKEFWKQDKIELQAKIESGTANQQVLKIAVKENNKVEEFKPEQRSQGLQWYLSFYMRLKNNKVDIDKDNIILIDEPGLYLHAKAQIGVLSVLENIYNDAGHPIIFSTHSPYLIDNKRLDRVKLVEKNEKNGSKIKNKFHDTIDNDSLTPIITAIGLDISKSLTLTKNKQVILEGITDYFYIRAMEEYLNKSSIVSYIPSTGAPKIHNLCSILMGWNLDFTCLFDNDNGWKQAKKHLEKLNITKDDIVFVSETDGDAIEDLFSINDAKEHVLGDKSKDIGDKLSTYLKKNEINKTILSYEFYQKILQNKGSISLSKNTKDAFEGLFKKIEDFFKKDISKQPPHSNQS